MVLAYISGKIMQNIPDNGRTIKSQALAFTSGSMVAATKANGIKTIWTALESINGWMAAYIQENISKIRSTDMAYSNGKMEENILATGPMENNMAWEFMKSQVRASRLASGNKEK